MADPDFGKDWSCTDDLDEMDRVVEGLELVGQDLYRRLTTRRGSVLGAPDYGFDVRSLLSKGRTQTELAAIPGLLRAEVLKDDRITSCVVTVEESSADKLVVALNCSTGEGPFDLVLDVTAAAAVLLGGP